MEATYYLLFLILGIIIGGVAVWLIQSARIKTCYDRAKSETAAEAAAKDERIRNLEQQAQQKEAERQTRAGELSALQDRLNNEKVELAKIETQRESEKKAAEENSAFLAQAKEKLSDVFKALSSEALKSNNESFLDLAKSNLEKFHEIAKGDLEKRQQAITELVKPISENLDKISLKTTELDKSRVGDYEKISEQIKNLLMVSGNLSDSNSKLQLETGKLVESLKSNQVRGIWGEIQLERIAEMAGMLEHCDFSKQETVQTEEGSQRPDLIVNLPGDTRIVIDSKAPINAYMEAYNATDENVKVEKLKKHARAVKDHINMLAEKAYWKQVRPGPDFVVLFMPGENFFYEAFRYDPSLIEYGVNKNVIIATPTLLIALLKIVAIGWREEKLAQNAREISDLGRDLYDRLKTMRNHWEDVGRNLAKSVTAYNSAVGTLETRVLVSARKFKELEAADNLEIELLTPIEHIPRQIQATEMSETSQPESENTE